jgi:hypothetical protein
LAIGTVQFRRRVAPLVVLALFAVVFGCGGSDSSNGGMTPTTCVTFVTAGEPTTFTAVSGSAACSAVEVEVRLNDVQDVYGGGFDITFDPATVGYDGLDASNSHLAEGGNAVTFLDGGPIPPGTGTVTIGFTRTGPVDGVDFDASQVLCTLTFKKIAGSGSSGLTLSQLTLKDSNGGDFVNVTASGGTFTVQ